jgi:hypothetical protein
MFNFLGHIRLRTTSSQRADRLHLMIEQMLQLGGKIGA